MTIIINSQFGKRNKVIALSTVRTIWQYKKQGLTAKSISKLVLNGILTENQISTIITRTK